MTTSSRLDHDKVAQLRRHIVTDDSVYQGMHKLKIRGKDLGKIPKELYVLTELEVLDLSPEREGSLYHRLSAASPSIGRLINLRVLMLDTNELTDIPEQICGLSQLESLSLSNNRLTRLPDKFDQLQRLHSLYLANNSLVVFPASICKITSLLFLDMSDNKIPSLPREVGELRNLETLIMCQNRLASLPTELCQLTELRSLWIGDNNIESLPRNIVRLAYLDWGQNHTFSSALDGNPLMDPPLDVCKKGVGAISKYFK